MASLDKQEIFSIFVSFLIGSVAGWWSRMYWGSHLITTLATLIGIVIGYYAIVAALRAADHLPGSQGAADQARWPRSARPWSAERWETDMIVRLPDQDLVFSLHIRR